jgi:carboxypeptidase C (cathepsin A)
VREQMAAALFCVLILLSGRAVVASDRGVPTNASKEGTASLTASDLNESNINLAPLPADKSVYQTVRLEGRTLKYAATIGSLPVLDEKGNIAGSVMFTAYTVPGTQRPVTFAVNGGPGASSVYLNLGTMGPKRLQFGVEDDSPSAAPVLTDNPASWLDFTDLVFIDPVGTGFSHARVGESEAKRRFYNAQADIEYLSRIIYDWLVKNERLRSAKYFVGESYGGFRGPRIAHFLQTRLGIALKGLVLVSPYLDGNAYGDSDLSPLPWMLTLPSIAAASLERQGKLTDARMAGIVRYARTDYMTDLLSGASDVGATERIIQRVVQLTGLDPAFVRRSGGRLDARAYLREVYRDRGKVGSRYDSNVTAWDPFPFSPSPGTGDPILDRIVAPATSAMVDFITRTVGWKYAGRYYALNGEVGRIWADAADGQEDEDEHRTSRESVQELRESLAIDQNLMVLIAHGWSDLSCPFMASVLIADQIPRMGMPDRVRVREYPGGHMFYNRLNSQLAWRRDVVKLYTAH